MKKALLAAAVFLAMTAQAKAENWIAVGILTKQNVKMNYFDAEYVEIKGFKNRESCMQVVHGEANTDEYIGVGGTSGKVPGLHWNYDATCIHINDE